MRRVVSGLGLLLVALSVGCSSQTENQTSGSKPGDAKSAGAKRIVFLINTPDPYWDTCEAGLKEADKELLAGTGLTAVMDRNNGTEEGQIDKLRQYASESDIVAVAVSVIKADNKAIADEMKNLMARGKKVITVDGDLNRAKFRECRTYYIGTDNDVAGAVLGTAARGVLKGRKIETGGYVQFSGFNDNDNARSRMNGFKAKVGEEYKELDRRQDETKKDKARDNVRNALTDFPNELSALVGIWAYNAPAIAQSVAERNAVGKYVIATFDADAQAIKEMEKGNIDVMCVQNPFDMGYSLVKLLKAMHTEDKATIEQMFPNAGKPDGDIYTTGLRIVVPNEESPLKADMFDPKTVEFMTLPKFQGWLNKYGLKSS